jgi:hypothetical protein
LSFVIRHSSFVVRRSSFVFTGARRMDWMSLILGAVLGSSVTAGLVWFSGSRGGNAQIDFRPVALSVVLTSIIGGLLRTGVDFGVEGAFVLSGLLFGGGWMLGGLLAGWVLTGPMRRK